MWPELHLETITKDSISILKDIYAFKFEFPKLFISSQSLVEIWEYMPEAKETVLYIDGQDDYQAVGQVIWEDLFTEIYIPTFCPMNGYKLLQLFSTLKDLSRLKIVSIACEMDVKMAFMLKQCLCGAFLEELNLELVYFNDRYLQLLCQALPETRIKKLNLYRNEISSEGLDCLGKVLLNTDIEELNIGRNYISRTGLESLANGMVGSKLKTLHLQECEELSPDDLDCVFALLPHIPLENFHYYGEFSKSTEKILIDNLPKSNLKSISFLISHYLPEFLKACSNIKDLLLFNDENGICFDIADNMKYLNLETLRFRHTKIQMDGLEKLMSAIVDSNIRHLYFSQIRWPLEALAILARYLPGTKIQELHLNGCNSTQDGIVEFAKCIKETRLKRLNIWSHCNSIHTISAILENIGSRIQYLDLTGARDIDRNTARKLVLQHPSLTIKY
ncbi:hypothetical protein HK103_006250 [Boothiomyces macroporosus]|uniref:Uncharacterized protein n=1 Tax=Boothiomyces macroporosus TaxID=261099 RepID=A0AAD5Y6S5_9FUNG|nr:hypothetical protein HK103_006250 [Boothiomyces macroporosus]